MSTKFAYTGQQFDAATGLYFLRARYYDPAIGRFLSQDPYPVNIVNPFELNRYVYTANNPVNLTDPSGLSPLVDTVEIETEVSKDILSVPWVVAPNGKAVFALSAMIIGILMIIIAALTIPPGVVPPSPVPSPVPTPSTSPTNPPSTDPQPIPTPSADPGVSTSSEQGPNTGSGTNPEISTGSNPDSNPVPEPVPEPDIQIDPDRCGAGTGSDGPDENNYEYFFRGTTAGYPGNATSQRLPVTSTTTRPDIATVFATVAETEYGGNGIVYITKQEDVQDLNTRPPNWLGDLECEVPFEIAPNDFNARSRGSVTDERARSILLQMGIRIDDRISLSDQTDFLRNRLPPSMTPQEIRQFASQAGVP